MPANARLSPPDTLIPILLAYLVDLAPPKKFSENTQKRISPGDGTESIGFIFLGSSSPGKSTAPACFYFPASP